MIKIKIDLPKRSTNVEPSPAEMRTMTQNQKILASPQFCRAAALSSHAFRMPLMQQEVILHARAAHAWLKMGPYAVHDAIMHADIALSNIQHLARQPQGGVTMTTWQLQRSKRFVEGVVLRVMWLKVPQSV